MSVTLPHPTFLTPPGAEEVIYAQNGETVKLDPPEGFKSDKYYLRWIFGSRELAWTNYMGGHKIVQGERHTPERRLV